MAHLGTNADNASLATGIESLVKSLHARLESEPDDVKVNAVARLAVVYLNSSNVTKEQAERLLASLIESVDDWKHDN